MKFSLATVATLVAAALAKPAFTNSEFDIEEGKPFTITWSGAVGPVTIQVVAGPDDQSLVPVQTITSTGADGTYTWTPSGLPTGKYALKISDSTPEPNFSIQFQYSGTGTLTSASMSSTTKPTSTVSSSTSSSSASTTSSASSSSSTSKTSSTSTSSTGQVSKPTNINNGPKYQSSLGLVLLTVAALVYFN